MKDLEFRFNVLVWTFLNVLWLGLALIFIELIFGQVKAIAGWSKDEVFLLIAVQTLFTGFMWMLVLENLGYFSHYIRHGDLDFVLLKPLNPRFFVSTRYFDSAQYGRMVASVFLILVLLGRLGVQPDIGQWLLFILLFALGFFIFYNLFFLITTTLFWLINVFNMTDLFDNIVSSANYPVYIFQGSLRFFFIYIIPMAFIATFPAQALLGQIGWEKLWLALFLGVVTFLASEWFWRFALKHYQSASS